MRTKPVREMLNSDIAAEIQQLQKAEIFLRHAGKSLSPEDGQRLGDLIAEQDRRAYPEPKRVYPWRR